MTVMKFSHDSLISPVVFFVGLGGGGLFFLLLYFVTSLSEPSVNIYIYTKKLVACTEEEEVVPVQ